MAILCLKHLEYSLRIFREEFQLYMLFTVASANSATIINIRAIGVITSSVSVPESASRNAAARLEVCVCYSKLTIELLRESIPRIYYQIRSQ